MTARTIYLDVTQFFRDPYASGIQRVLWGLAANWPSDLAQGVFVARPRGSKEKFSLLAPGDVSKIIESVFADRGHRSEWPSVVDRQLRDAEFEQRSIGELLRTCSIWVLPEVSYDHEVLATFDQAAGAVPTGAIFYDAFPETAPSCYPQGNGAGIVSTYFRRMAETSIAVSISDQSNDDLLRRLRRDLRLTSVVSHPGGDHVPVGSSPVPERPAFAIVSTLEARKRHDVLIEAFVRSRPRVPDAQLLILGRASGTAGPAIGAMDAAREAGADITWNSAPSDRDIEKGYAQATAVFCIGDEGYGFGALEAIRRGCPVVFAGQQPAAELCEGRGSVRLPELSVDAVAEAMIKLSDVSRARALRADIDPDAVPTWDTYARKVVDTFVNRRGSSHDGVVARPAGHGSRC